MGLGLPEGLAMNQKTVAFICLVGSMATASRQRHQPPLGLCPGGDWKGGGGDTGCFTLQRRSFFYLLVESYEEAFVHVKYRVRASVPGSFNQLKING